MEWKGAASDGTEVVGKVTVPEVSHEVTVDGLSDYQVSQTQCFLEKAAQLANDLYSTSGA